MAPPTLFIGVVSHPQSNFAVNQGLDGLAAKLCNELASSGTSCEYVVNVRNEFESSGISATESVFRQGIAEEVRLERTWSGFLGARRGARWWLRYLARWARVRSYALRKSDVDEIKRLINIELSHLALMRDGLSSGASWILILEDDAGARDLNDLAKGLRSITQSDPAPGYVNLSRSFSTTELGIDHLLTTAANTGWGGAQHRKILEAARPATNTVCAILYHRHFLEKLVNEIESVPAEPVVPIDWRLNLALMNLWNKGLIGKGDCWFVEPAPIDQLSMHS